MVFISTSHSRWMDERVGHLLQLQNQRLWNCSRSAASSWYRVKSLPSQSRRAGMQKNYSSFKRWINSKISHRQPFRAISFILPARGPGISAHSQRLEYSQAQVDVSLHDRIQPSTQKGLCAPPRASIHK